MVIIDGGCRFTFYQLGYSVNETQQIMFSVFLAILILPALLNASIPKHFILKSIWQARESHSTYSWVAWMSAVLINEVPYAILMSIIYWPLAYWPVGLPFGEPAGEHSREYYIRIPRTNSLLS